MSCCTARKRCDTHVPCVGNQVSNTGRTYDQFTDPDGRNQCCVPMLQCSEWSATQNWADGFSQTIEEFCAERSERYNLPPAVPTNYYNQFSDSYPLACCGNYVTCSGTTCDSLVDASVNAADSTYLATATTPTQIMERRCRTAVFKSTMHGRSRTTSGLRESNGVRTYLESISTLTSTRIHLSKGAALSPRTVKMQCAISIKATTEPRPIRTVYGTISSLTHVVSFTRIGTVKKLLVIRHAARSNNSARLL